MLSMSCGVTSEARHLSAPRANSSLSYLPVPAQTSPDCGFQSKCTTETNPTHRLAWTSNSPHQETAQNGFVLMPTENQNPKCLWDSPSISCYLAH